MWWKKRHGLVGRKKAYLIGEQGLGQISAIFLCLLCMDVCSPHLHAAAGGLLVRWTALGNQVSHPACHETAALLTKRQGIPSSLCLQTLPLWDKPLSTPVQHDAKVV